VGFIKVPFLPEAAALYKQRLAGKGQGRPSAPCLPRGVASSEKTSSRCHEGHKDDLNHEGLEGHESVFCYGLARSQLSTEAEGQGHHSHSKQATPGLKRFLQPI
jgi:hypothetical protein